MANVDAIPAYLAATFPTLPSEIKDYVSSILKENVDELLTLEDVMEAVGDHIQSYVQELCNDGLNRTCLQLLQFLHGENLPKVEKHGKTTKKLDQAVDMAAENHSFAEMESIWKVQARDVPTSVDKKKLGKAENRAAQKIEQRDAEPVARKKRPESSATASQAPVKDLGLRGSNVKDVKLESVDISIGTKENISETEKNKWHDELAKLYSEMESLQLDKLWEGTILTVSHDRKFLNEICTDIVHLHTRRLDHYRGNYDNFEKTMKEKLTQQQREYEAQQTLRQHTQEFIDKFRYNAKRAAMVQSRIKMLEKLPVLHAVELDADITFKFPQCEVLNNPVLQLDDVSFRYNEDTAFLFKKLNLGTHANSRICIHGMRNVNRRIRIGYFTQHHVDQLDMDMTAIEVLAHNYPGKTQEEYRTALSHFGLVGDMALQSVYTLSGGQKSRLAFANIAMLNPNYLILDEPTNHLDVETVAALGAALNIFNGGVVLVSHDEQLIEMVCKELWVVKDRMVVNLEGGLEEYRKQVYKQLQLIS
ncbi:ABC transporter, ATP-binding protein [Teladorsagia circumcincta]|uniref:ABC transporter, ATP-binding protein n=1 Tax=Teladorsagia circumcincta TaxID=45464 RepID=A0A2G9UX08_TELCI|nr:ABC transporter, ATP-binding protein [Teladorsagia circumcincta]